MSTAAKGRKGPQQHSAKAHALMMQAVPYFAQKMPVHSIAALFRKSERQVTRWANHPDVRKALGEVGDAVVEATKVQATELVELAWRTLSDVMRSGEDERTRVEAAKLVLDRTGHGPTSKQEVKLTEAPGTREEALARLNALRAKLGGEGA
jgi:hypothetical protein